MGLYCRARGTPGSQRDALQHFLISHQFAEFLRQRYPLDECGLSRAGFFARRAYVYEQIVELLVAHGRDKEALAYVEVAKARILQDTLVAAGGMSARSSEKHCDIIHLLSSWPSDVAALEYFVATERSWVFVVSPGGEVTAHPLVDEGDKAIRSGSLIGEMRDCLTDLNATIGRMKRGAGFDDGWQHALDRMRRILLPEPALTTVRQATTVIVVPHHILHYFPFAALVTEVDAANRGRFEVPEPRFLLDEDFHLCYCPSLTTWKLLRHRTDTAVGNLSAVGVGAAAGLPGVAKELTALRTVFGSTATKCFEHERATCATARRLLRDRGFVFFGVHGVNNPERPLESHLQFYPGPGSDWMLTARQVYSLPLKADLVVMSACDSGLADQSPMPGDDLFGLQRAFLQSGARAVVSGQWKVYDGTAPLLMTAFFEQLAKGEAVAAALANAQRRFLNSQRTTQEPNAWCHPVFWAVYSVAGDDRVHLRVKGE